MMTAGAGTGLPIQLSNSQNGKIQNRHCERTEAIHAATKKVGKSGLLRGACHRARIRATRWLTQRR